MKSLFLIFSAILLTFFNCQAQNQQGKTEDSGRLILNTFIPDNADGMTLSVYNYLENKLSMIAATNGMGGDDMNSRFIISANIDVISKDITPTAPPMHAYTLDVTLFIGDGIDGIKYASHSVTLKGVGTNETKAYMSALKTLKVKDPRFKEFIDNGKSGIIGHYNSKCDFILKQAEMLVSNNDFDAAIYNLSNVPEVCLECYNKSMDAIVPIYQKKIDKECIVKLSEANLIWNSGQNLYAANNAGRVLTSIDPRSACYNNAITLNNKIAKAVKELNDRDWEFKLKQDQDNVNNRRAYLDAIRSVGEAYGKAQPQTVIYRVRDWY